MAPLTKELLQDTQKRRWWSICRLHVTCCLSFQNPIMGSRKLICRSPDRKQWFPISKSFYPIGWPVYRRDHFFYLLSSAELLPQMATISSLPVIWSRREQYYWVRYWYWVILGCFRTIGIGIGIGIVKGFSKYWYWYWVLLRAFLSIGIGIGYC